MVTSTGCALQHCFTQAEKWKQPRRPAKVINKIQWILSVGYNAREIMRVIYSKMNKSKTKHLMEKIKMLVQYSLCESAQGKSCF